jgi:gas vesicle protein
MLKFVFGVLVGASIALLMAPKSGGELRDDLSSRVDKSIEQGESAARKISRRARELGDQAQEQVRRGTDAAQVALQTARKSTEF